MLILVAATSGSFKIIGPVRAL
eukprot:COSAG01_NODE_10866_length_2066_cov_1.188612_3_plen_21_part_01